MRPYTRLYPRYRHKRKREKRIENRRLGFSLLINWTWPFFHFTKWEIWGHFDRNSVTYEGGVREIVLK